MAPKSKNLIGYERDGAVVLSVDQSRFSVRCACGSIFVTNRRRIRENSTTLRCANCFKSAQRERSIENGTIFTEKLVAAAENSPENLFADVLRRLREEPAFARLPAQEQARKAAHLMLTEL